jgi:uncharacterized protein CbrC (UPF0167 family)
MFPDFKYHPFPLKTGSISSSAVVCQCCGLARGYIYNGPVYAEHNVGRICPWCIADGSAAEKFQAEFADATAIGDFGAWGYVSSSVVEEVSRRTPGFSGWQQERWWVHCNDAAAYLGRAGQEEIEEFGPDLEDALKRESGVSNSSWPEYFAAMEAGGSPRAYVFRCLHCGELGGYSDCD